MEVDDNSLLTGDTQKILGEQLRPHSILLLNIIIRIINYRFFKLLFLDYKSDDHSVQMCKRKSL
jgi:hypothetical protein